MNYFFLVLELLFIYGFSIFLLINKRELSIVYLPVLFFVIQIITPSIPAVFYYGTISIIIVYLISKNGFFYRNNIYSIIIFCYFLILLSNSDNLTLSRPLVFSALWLFILIPLISSIYQKYAREEVFKEISNAALLILTLFIINSILSSYYKFSPAEMYNITSGILYGNLLEASLNVLAIALFILLLKIISERNLLSILIFIISLSFVMLTLRRSVMGVSLFGVSVAALTLMTKRKAKMLFLFGSICFLVGFLVYSNTDFMSQFNERVELRKLESRQLTEEGRFLEYELVYKDMFVYDEYSPWFGFELFNSWGNYGKGILGERSLHGDITNIAHSSGILGVLLYLLMVKTAFMQSFRSVKTPGDKLIILFCALTFFVYTITGRYTELASSLLLFLLLMLPLTREESMTKINLSDASE